MAAAATAPQKFSPREDNVTKPSAMMAAIAAAAALISMPPAQAAAIAAAIIADGFVTLSSRGLSFCGAVADAIVGAAAAH